MMSYTEEMLSECRRILKMMEDYGLDDFASQLGYQSMKNHEADLIAEIEREQAQQANGHR